MKELQVGKRNFKLVEKIPTGYSIWYIGSHMSEGYLPLCQCDKDYHVNPDTLKAIKCDDAQDIMMWCACASTEKEERNRFNEIIKRFNS